MRNTLAGDGEVFGTTILYAVIIALLAGMTSAMVAVPMPMGPGRVRTASMVRPAMPPAARPVGLG